MPPRLSLTAPHATLRWVRADLLARRVQAILTVAVVAGVVAALLLAAMLLEGTTNPWQGLYARTHGADVMIRFGYGTDLAGGAGFRYELIWAVWLNGHAYLIHRDLARRT